MSIRDESTKVNASQRWSTKFTSQSKLMRSERQSTTFTKLAIVNNSHYRRGPRERGEKRQITDSSSIQYHQHQKGILLFPSLFFIIFFCSSCFGFLLDELQILSSYLSTILDIYNQKYKRSHRFSHIRRVIPTTKTTLRCSFPLPLPQQVTFCLLFYPPPTSSVYPLKDDH